MLMAKKQGMNRRRFLNTGLMAMTAAGISNEISVPGWTATSPEAPSNDEMFGWVEDMYRFGQADRYGYRMPGTKSDRQCAEYLLKKFQQFGLKDAKMEPWPVAAAFPDRWDLTVRANGKTENIPCYFLRYVKFTGPSGISAPLVYVHEGNEADFAGVDVKGKIVVANVGSPGQVHPRTAEPDKFKWPESFFTYDPGNTLAGEKWADNYPLSIQAPYQNALKRGAAGLIGILDAMAGDMNQYLHVYLQYELPAVTISPRAGARLVETLRSGAAEATIVLTGFQGQAETYNLYGFVPGKREDEIIVMSSHHDGWATNEASGTSVVLGVAKYFAQLPPRTLNRTLMFYLAASHFGAKADWAGADSLRGLPREQATTVYNLKADFWGRKSLAYQVVPKVVCSNTVEMLGRQYKRNGDDFVPTGRPSARLWGVTGPTPFEANPVLLGFMRDAIRKHKLVRSAVYQQFQGEAPYPRVGVPTVFHITFNNWQFTYKDTPETVEKEALRPTVDAFIDMIGREDVADAASLGPTAPFSVGAPAAPGRGSSSKG
jgi:hypothetical protein